MTKGENFIKNICKVVGHEYKNPFLSCSRCGEFFGVLPGSVVVTPDNNDPLKINVSYSYSPLPANYVVINVVV